VTSLVSTPTRHGLCVATAICWGRIMERRERRRLRATARQAIVQTAVAAAERAEKEGKSALAEAIRLELTCISFRVTPPSQTNSSD
jgi:hypothetical protein